jgi:hypothetical protein
MMGAKPFGNTFNPVTIVCQFPNGVCFQANHWIKCFLCGILLHIGTQNHKCMYNRGTQYYR